MSSVWKPEFERSGKHFVYVGEYTRFLIVLAKETHDVELLNSLARKVRRAHGLLLDLKEIWELLYESYLAILAGLVGSDPIIPVAEVVPRTDFREKAAIYETKMFEQESQLPDLVLLQRLCELKKLNDKMAPEGQMAHLLAVCYSKLFIAVGGVEMYPKEVLDRLENPTEYAKRKEKEKEREEKEKEQKEAKGVMDVATPYQIASRKYGSNGDESNDEEGEVEEIADQLKDKDTTVGGDLTMIESEKSNGDKQGSSPSSTLVAEPRKSLASIADLSTDIQPAATNDDTNLADVNSGSAPVPPTDQAPETTDVTMVDATTRDTAVVDSTDVEMLAPAPETSGQSEDRDAASTEATAVIEPRPTMEDWETRKKISEAELASRATAMCKAPPPSLKAPQTLQSKLAEQDHATDGGFDSGAEAGPENGYADDKRTDVETAHGSADVAMESRDEDPDVRSGDKGQGDTEVNGVKDADSEKDDADGAGAEEDEGSEVGEEAQEETIGDEKGQEDGDDDDDDDGENDEESDDSNEEQDEEEDSGEGEKNDMEDMEEDDEREGTEASEENSNSDSEEEDDGENSEEDSDEDMEDNDAEEDLEGDNSDSDEEVEGSDEEGDESNTEEAGEAEEAADSEEVESEGHEDQDEEEKEENESAGENEEEEEEDEDDEEEEEEEEEEEIEAAAVGPDDSEDKSDGNGRRSGGGSSGRRKKS